MQSVNVQLTHSTFITLAEILELSTRAIEKLTIDRCPHTRDVAQKWLLAGGLRRPAC